ncbi:ABC transporter ATP-binding protein [Alphaproteobacteria bacterium]|nr:ABC transporter ATP-binding protein [Alphaproteobacteria bacterium]
MDLVAKGLTLEIEGENHLDDISFGMRKGELYTLLGRTLAGKTTLLKTIAGLITPDSGRLLFEDCDLGGVPVWERNIAMVYQQFINYPHLNVFENVAFPLRQRKVDPAAINRRVMTALSSVGLDGFEGRKIQALSGGQQQRVALARSLAKEAGILLLDEPLVNLDYKLREQLREEFRNIFSSTVASDSILIYSSTDPLEAMQLGGEVIVLDEARVLQQGPGHEIFENPANTRVAEISNDPAMNLMNGTIGDGSIQLGADMALPLPPHFKGLTPGDYIFGLRASDVILADKGISFTVELSEISGSETYLHFAGGAHKFVGLLDMVRNFKAAETVSLSLDVKKIYAFDMAGDLVSSPFGGGR